QVREAQAVVGRIGFGVVGEPAAAPVEAPAVHDDAADGVAVAADPLGGGVDDDVGTPLDGAAQDGGGESVVHDEGNARVVGHFGHRFHVQHRQAGVADDLREDGFGAVGDGPPEVVGVG